MANSEIPAHAALPQPIDAATMLMSLKVPRKSNLRKCLAKKTTYKVKTSTGTIDIDSWRFNEWDYKKAGLPTYARGLFTGKDSRGNDKIFARGYDKFFNTNEVADTQWDKIESQTKGPYELSLKENGCIIFIAALEDDTLLVCSKHATGGRANGEHTHSSFAEGKLEEQLAKIGKTKTDLAQELRRRDCTAVVELCDDTFEEHILPYGPDMAGLYLHGLNKNIPQLATEPSLNVQQFAREWGFIENGLLIMDDVKEARAFLEKVGETGAHEGRDIEGFVVRCKLSRDPKNKGYEDWFFKYKYDEPYLLYRQWRECTKAVISGEPPRIRNHHRITREYLDYARERLAQDPELGPRYMKNHGIIALRNGFLKHKNITGAEAAAYEDEASIEIPDKAEVTRDVVLAPISTIGCGKTTIALALSRLFGFGHVQNDNITGKARPPRFVGEILSELNRHSAVIADRNNARRYERKQLVNDFKARHPGARLVALNFVHDDKDKVRRVAVERVLVRGDGHQTIQAATNAEKAKGIINSFLKEFEPCDPEAEPDSGFETIINLDPLAGSRKNLETVVTELYQQYPKLVSIMPSAEEMDKAIEAALNYKPTMRHTIPDRRTKQNPPDSSKGGASNKSKKVEKAPQKRKLQYMAVDVAPSDVLIALEKTFSEASSELSKFWQELKDARRVQLDFHVTLAYVKSSKDHSTVWQRYASLWDEAQAQGKDLSAPFGELDVQLERAVWDDRVMALVVRLVPRDEDVEPDGASKWPCVNRVAHITVGTRSPDIPPVESNTMLARWLDSGSGGDTNIQEVNILDKPTLKGKVQGKPAGIRSLGPPRVRGS